MNRLCLVILLEDSMPCIIRHIDNVCFDVGVKVAVPNKRSHYYSFLVQLEEQARKRQGVAGRNLDADPSSPCVYAAIKPGRPPEAIEALRMFFKSGSPARRYGMKVDSETMKRHTKLEGALARRDRIVSEYRSEGWTVVNVDPPHKHCVYVIELREPAEKGMKVSYYVGQTSLTPTQRYERHKKGLQANSRVERYGFRLRQDLAGNTGLMTHLESLRQERTLAEKLKSQGHSVYGGH